MPHAFANTVASFKTASGKSGKYYSLPKLAERFPNVNQLPVSIRLVLESVLRNCDGKRVTAEHVEQLANWQPNAPRTEEIPFVVARVVLQDFTGVPLLADLAAMRNVAKAQGKDPKTIEPLVPVDLVVDHSVMIDHFGTPEGAGPEHEAGVRAQPRALRVHEVGHAGLRHLRRRAARLRHRPPGQPRVPGPRRAQTGSGADTVYYPDTLVGTDCHTTMINGIGVVGWGVGGIEAEAGMLGQPVYFLTPDVVGVRPDRARLREGVTATDLVLTVTEILRKAKVVGKFVEFFGEGTASLTVADRATIGNMAPEYGATMGFFPVDERTIDYFKGTGRTRSEIEAFEAYLQGAGPVRRPASRATSSFTQVVALDLGTVVAVSWPARSARRTASSSATWPSTFASLFTKPVAENGFNQPAEKLPKSLPARRHAEGAGHQERRRADRRDHLLHQHVQPERAAGRGPAGQEGGRGGPDGPAAHQDLAGAGLARRHRVPRQAPACCRTWRSWASAVAAYGCTTCIGNAGDLTPEMNEAITDNDLVCAAVLSGNRNFEARIHPNIKANFLASPPLVVAYAIAGNVTRDLMTEPVGKGKDGKRRLAGRHLADRRGDRRELLQLRAERQGVPGELRPGQAENPGQAVEQHRGRDAARSTTGPTRTYIAEPPFFERLHDEAGRGRSRRQGRAAHGAVRRLDHHRPHLAGRLDQGSLARGHLAEGARRAEGRLQQLRLAPRQPRRDDARHLRQRAHQEPDDPARRRTARREEGGVTLFQPSGEKMFIYDAAMKYIAAGHAHRGVRRRGIRHRLRRATGRPRARSCWA